MVTMVRQSGNIVFRLGVFNSLAVVTAVDSVVVSGVVDVDVVVIVFVVVDAVVLLEGAPLSQNMLLQCRQFTRCCSYFATI